MCGVAGLVGERPGQGEVTARRMTDALIHRGPHSGGIHTAAAERGEVALGARRLRILDLSDGADQPLTSGSTGAVLTFNGEVYNFRELRDDLRRRNHVFETSGDSEVVLRALEEWGPACFERFRGMFALALWDPRSQSVLLARDQLGIKPLYIAAAPGSLAWASEVRSLKLALPVTTIDQDAVDDFLSFGSVLEPRTIYREIAMFPAGTWMRLRADGTIEEQHEYWTLRQHSTPTGPSSHLEQGRQLLARSVSRHLVSDAPLGILLSSGMDSRTVLGLATPAAGEGLHSFTVSFPDDPTHDEGNSAAESARAKGSVHQDVAVSSTDALTWIEDGLAAMDQPSLDGLNTYIVTRAIAQQGLVVALSGLGGDELFAGYPAFKQLPRWLTIQRLIDKLPPRPTRQMLLALASVRSQASKRKMSDLLGAGADLRGMYLGSRRVLAQSDMARLGRSVDPAREAGRPLPEADTRDPVNAISLWEIGFYLRNTLLRDADVFSMANSIELRVPFVDVDLVEWAIATPGAMKIRRGHQKPLLAELAGDALAARGGAKRGFTLPFSTWLSGPLKDTTRTALADLGGTGWFERQGINEIWQRYEREPRSTAWSRVWTLVSLSAWVSRHG